MNKYNLNEAELQFIACLYYSGKSAHVNEDGEIEALDEEIAKDILEFHGITGWDNEKNTYTRIIHA